MKPVVQPLAKWQRTLIFVSLLLAFIVSLPVFMFYATGYRYDFFAETPTITATGGMYITAEAEDSLIYIDEELVDNARVFRSAYYMQGLEPGTHRVHVQAEGLHTWVKELTIAPHMVTEAEAFNLPMRPQVRPITRYFTGAGDAVLRATTTSTGVVDKASTTIPFYLATTSATSTFRVNAEYDLLEALFVEKAAAKAAREAFLQMSLRADFGFATTVATGSVPSVLATTTKNLNDLSLYQVDQDIYVASLAPVKDRPHYFCSFLEIVEPEKLPEGSISLMEDEPLDLVEINQDECRDQIKIDRQGQAVVDFEFMPQNSNLILLLLENGVYVVEIDDRSWQNAQLLYPGEDLQLVLYGDNIFVKEANLILELLTEINEA